MAARPRRGAALPYYDPPLRSAFWIDAMERYRQILYYPPGDAAYYVPLGLLAALRGVGMNVAYKARSDSALAAEAERELLRDLESGDLQPRALYVFKDQSTYDALRSRPSSSEIMLKEVDGLYVAGRVRVDE